jgi:hypothetical protein
VSADVWRKRLLEKSAAILNSRAQLWNLLCRRGHSSGNWPLIVSNAKADNGKYCLTLTDDGRAGWSHSGAASINTGLNGQQQTGIFQFIGHTIVVSIDNPGETQNAGTVCAFRASKGVLEDGAFSEMYGGESVNSGKILFGARAAADDWR